MVLLKLVAFFFFDGFNIFYFFGFRNRGVFYESLVNEVLDDLVAAARPRRMKVTGDFTPRGGITSTVVAEYVRPPRRKKK